MSHVCRDGSHFKHFELQVTLFKNGAKDYSDSDEGESCSEVYP